MNYSPKKKDKKARILYASLLVLSFLLMNIGQGTLKSILSTVSLLLLSASLYLFIRFEMTSYTYLLPEENGQTNFYVNKSVGRRGNYVYYQPWRFFVASFSQKADVLKAYEKVAFYHYTQNLFDKKSSFLVFQTEDGYDCVEIEAPKEMFSYLEKKGN